MRQMRHLGILPVEQIPYKGKVALDGIMYKQLFYDDVNILHCNAALSSMDAVNCYDTFNYPVRV